MGREFMILQLCCNPQLKTTKVKNHVFTISDCNKSCHWTSFLNPHQSREQLFGTKTALTFFNTSLQIIFFCYINVTDKSQRVLDFVEDILQMLLGRIKSPSISNPCIFQSVPNKEDQRRVKLFFYSGVLNSKC